MKKLILGTSIAIAAASFIAPSHALTTEHKRELSFGGLAVVGALVGGPVGYVVGAISGAVMADQIKQADVASNETKLLQQQYVALEQELQQAANEARALQASLAAQAQTPVFFNTGSDQLSLPELEKLQSTIALLQKQTALRISLDGYADPRGTDGYNTVLSQHRALAVKDVLVASGINENRIRVQGHGIKIPADHANTSTYALERRVDIQLLDEPQAVVVMQ